MSAGMADQEPPPPRPYPCKVCGRAFRTNKDRRNHIGSTGHGKDTPVNQPSYLSRNNLKQKLQGTTDISSISAPLSNLTMNAPSSVHHPGKRSRRPINSGDSSAADYKRQKHSQFHKPQPIQASTYENGAIHPKQTKGLQWNQCAVKSNTGGFHPISSPDLRSTKDPIMLPNSPSFPSHSDGMVYSNNMPATSDAVQNLWTMLDPVFYREAWGLLRPHSQQCLTGAGYRLRSYAYIDLKGFKKCRNCGKQAKFHTTPVRKICSFHTEKRSPTMNDRNERVWQCCGETQPCQTLPEHQYYDIDKQTKDRYLTLEFTPARTIPYAKRAAVVLDCEMVGLAGGYRELVRFSAVDYITGEVIIDTHVQPQSHVADWNTRYSGVSYNSLQEAYARNNVLAGGWREAREELYRYIDAETILIGQSLDNDLSVLRMLHLQIVDSQILAQECVGVKRGYKLKTLCSELVGKQIQTNAKRGHEPLEDCMATREVVLWMTRNPEMFKEWGAEKKREEEERRAEEKKKRLEEQAKKAAEKAAALEKERQKGSGPLLDENIERSREAMLDLGYPLEVVQQGHGLLY